MKRKLWSIIAASMAAIAISLCFFGVRVRIAPRLVLSGALNKTLAQLDSRYADSPLRILENVLDSAGCYQAELQLETDSDFMGLTRYDMDLKAQLSPLRVTATGTVVTGGKALDISLYLDRDFAAVSSDSLVKGNYYGITYDTFSQDIRSRELLAVLIGEDTVSQWENSVSSLAKTMSADLKLPDFSLSDIRTALYSVLALKPQVSKQQIDISGEKAMVYAVSFQTTGQQILEAAQPHQDELTPPLSAWIDKIKQNPDILMKATFYLSRGEIIKLETNMQQTGSSSFVCATVGTGSESEPLTLNWEVKDRNSLDRFSLWVTTNSDSESYQEEIRLNHTRNGIQKSWIIDYDYDLSSSEMDLLLTGNGKQAEVRVHLAAAGKRLTITSQNIAPFIDIFRKKTMKSPAICTFSIMPGQAVVTPEYRNLDQWSMDDLWTLLKGLGSLIGLNIA